MAKDRYARLDPDGRQAANARRARLARERRARLRASTLIRPEGKTAAETRHMALVLAGWVAGRGGSAGDLREWLQAAGLLHDPQALSSPHLAGARPQFGRREARAVS